MRVVKGMSSQQSIGLGDEDTKVGSVTDRLPTSSTIQSIGGVPTLMAGENPLPSPVFSLCNDASICDDVVGTLSRNGVDAFGTGSSLGVGSCPQTDATIELAVQRQVNVVRVAPGTSLMAHFLFFPAEQWLIEHPHEGFITADRRILVLGPDGESGRRDYVRVPGPSIKDVSGRTLHGEDARILYGRRRVSPFSELFARAARGSIKKFLAAMRAQGVADRLAGISIGCYLNWEWNLYMSAPDHGQRAIQGFRRYLREKYENDKALQASWADPSVTLKHALPPREYARIDLEPFMLGSQRQVDYQAAEARALAEQLAIIARGIKHVAPHLVVGGLFPGANAPQSDWLRLSQDSAVDFLATPLTYENRGPGGGIGSQSPFCDGFAALGKVWRDQLDTRTVVADKAVHGRYGRARTVAESVGLLWRDAGQMLIRGHHAYWVDFGNGGKPPYCWHLKPAMLKFHKRFGEIWRGLRDLDRRRWGQIKVFMPSEAARDFQVLHLADCQRHTEWTLLGAPVEFDVLENLMTGRSRPGKLNVIHGAGCLSREQLQRLKACLRGSKSMVVWTGGAGLFEAGRTVDEYRAEGLVPLQQSFSALEAPLEAEGLPTPQAVKWLGLPRRLRMGQYDRLFTSGFTFMSTKLNVPMKRVALKWILEITDPAAMPLARLTTTGAVVAAMKKDPTGTTHVVYNLPVLNSVVLRALAKRAGCHLFARQDDVVYASQGLVLLHAAYSGTHRLYFPRRVALWDLILDQSVPLRGCCLKLELTKGETRLYRWD